MAHIDNEFNKRFSNQQLPNDDFDAEGLWDSISEDLDNGQAVPSDGSIFTGRWIAGSIMLLFILGILGIIYWKSVNPVITQNADNQVDNIIQTDSNNTIIAPSNSKENNPSNIYTNNNESTNTVQIISPKDEAKKQIDTSDKARSKASSNPFSTHNDTQKMTPSKPILSPEILLIKTQNTSNKITPPNLPSIPTNNSSAFSTDNVETNNFLKSPIDNMLTDSQLVGSTNENQVAVSFSTLPAIVVFIEDTPQNQLQPTIQPILELYENEGLKPQKSQHFQWNVGLTGGINTLRFNHQSDNYNDLADLKNTTAKQDLGTSYSINTGLVFKYRWLLNSGLEYHQLWSKFDYEEVQEIQVLKEGQLLQVWVDAVTGDTLNALYGDTLVNATSTRTVLHHNQFQRVSIPLEIGMQETNGKFIYGITAGTVFNFTHKQSGRTLNKSGEMVDFNENDTTAPYKSFDIGLRASPLMGYQLSENWSLSLRPQWTWQRNTSFDDTDIKTGFHQINLNLGFRYSFK